jgi:UDP-N-acetylglucosamine 2-epimerase (non-hydrolysing)
MRITIVAGARPNFMKIAPIIKSIRTFQKSGKDIKYRLVHTGQHYDNKMSGDFFKQLGLPQPDANLQAGSGTQAEQTAAIMIGFEGELINNKADIVLVVGDVTSTMACAITAKKLHVDVCHVEAGIRSLDRSMPEEINRMLTDSITDIFFTTTKDAGQNLINEGHSIKKIQFVGNTMIDTLLDNLDYIVQPSIFNDYDIEPLNYLTLTLHRPSNVDEESHLVELLSNILKNLEQYHLIFPVHPRTAKVLKKSGFNHDQLIMTEPMGYLEFIYLIKNSLGVITDSGGITEETTVLGIPCITIRDSTERPETVSIGTNELIGANPKDIGKWVTRILQNNWKKGRIPPLWDGKTSDRILKYLCSKYSA